MRVALASAIAVLAVTAVAVAAGEKSEPSPDEPVSSRPPSTGPSQPADAESCSAETSLGQRPRQIEFEVSCEFEPTNIVVDPSRELLSVRAKASVQGGDPQGDPGQFFDCKRDQRGASATCLGRAENGATIRGVMRVRGQRCKTATRFEITGGVDCDGDEACIELAVIDERTDRRPSGC